MPRSFKSDESFLEKISMGAIGTQRVFLDMASQGHRPIELERGSRSFKLWKQIKIKRIRVPDILCVSCGHKVESRAKTSFMISMSHSLADPERGWDSGLGQHDKVALVVCGRSGNRPIDWAADDLVQYAEVEDLRKAVNDQHALITKPKGREEGFETVVLWPSCAAKYSGTVAQVGTDRVQYRRENDNRLISLRLSRRDLIMNPQVHAGDKIVVNKVLAAVVPVTSSFSCAKSVTKEYFIGQLKSMNLSERYAASKALGIFHSEDVIEALIGKVNEENEHIYVKLEAAASLARFGQSTGWSFVENCICDEYLENRLEAVIVLGEIHDDESIELLCRVLEDKDQHPEIRAGAAWALGELPSERALDLLVSSFAAVDESIRIEAARALAKLAPLYKRQVLSEFVEASAEGRPGIAWALSKSSSFAFEDLKGLFVDTDARHWGAYILGTQRPELYLERIEEIRESDPELYFAVTLLWKILSSWVFNLEEYG